MDKIKEFFANDSESADPVKCRKLQIYPLDGLSIRVMGIESSGRRMTTYYTLDTNTKNLDGEFDIAISEFLEAAGLEK